MRLPPLPPSRDRRIGLALAAFALAGAVVAAARSAWICDDAFICFRYARNWIEGLGLVFNAGERVEGFSNPLWTAWIALGMKLGRDPERWTITWGVAAFAGTVATLIAVHREARRRAGRDGLGVPLGALAAVFHAELVAYATSGLETSAFTFLALAGLALVAFPGGTRRAFAAGLLLGLASVTRHDGLLFAAVGAAATAAGGRRAIRHALALAAGITLVFAPVSAARVAYYGAFFPNTYYAKSGGLAWWSQGLSYLALYAQRYWAVIAGLAVWIAAAARLPRDDPRRASLVRPGLVFVAGGLVYAAYVTRVGGDFMFARLLVPATPPLLAAADLALLALAPSLEAAGAAAAIYLGALALTPSPFSAGADGRPQLIHGIADERAFYSPAEIALEEHRAAVVAPFLAGLPVRVAFYGTEARFVYRTRIPVAVEAHAGLTDAFVAHRALTAHGRVGHEKLAPASYLLGDRKIHLVFSRVPTEELRLDDLIPRVRVRFGDVVARVLTWDPALFAELRRRGAHVPDFPRTLDDYIATALPTAPRAEVEANYLMTGRFYFSLVEDPTREDAFRRKLGLPLLGK